MENNDFQDNLLALFLHGKSILDNLGSREKEEIDAVDVVFVDVVNGQKKPRVVSEFLGILTAMSDGSKPIGLILQKWGWSEEMKFREFANLTDDEMRILAGEFARAQDIAQEVENEMGNDL